MPEKDTVPAPYKIVQTPDLILFLYESRTIYRQIFMDGRALPTDPNPTWQGYSVGHWDGDTLVVETAGFNGKEWLDMSRPSRDRGDASHRALHAPRRGAHGRPVRHQRSEGLRQTLDRLGQNSPAAARRCSWNTSAKKTTKRRATWLASRREICPGVIFEPLWPGILAFAAGTWLPAQQAAKPVNVDGKVLHNTGAGNDALPGSWLTYGRNQSETRYSTLKQINDTNAKRLGLAWSYVVGAGGGNQEGTPLMWNNTLYGITTWSVVYALDARTGKELWRWDPEVNQTAVRPKICCGMVNRGVAITTARSSRAINDGRLQALDAITGKPVWESRVAYPQDLYT